MCCLRLVVASVLLASTVICFATPPRYTLTRVPYLAGNTVAAGTGGWFHIFDDGTISVIQRPITNTAARTVRYDKHLNPMVVPIIDGCRYAKGYSHSGKNYVYSRYETGVTGSQYEGSDSLMVDGHYIRPQFDTNVFWRVAFSQINDDGIAVGAAYYSGIGPIACTGVTYNVHTGAWTYGPEQNDDYYDERYYGINSNGQILVGTLEDSITSPNLYMRYPDGRQVHIGGNRYYALTEQGAVMHNDLSDPNNVKTVAWLNGKEHAFVRDGNVHRLVAAIIGRPSSNGIIIGRYDVGSQGSTFVGVDGTLYLLDPLLNRGAADGGLKLNNVYSVNSAGQILCSWSDTKTGTGGFGLLQPVPEPGTLAMLGIGVLAATRRRAKA